MSKYLRKAKSESKVNTDSASLHPSAPYQALLRQLLSQLQGEHSGSPQTLKAVVWLIYRLLDLDDQLLLPYLALAYVFALLGEWQRSQQILLYADQTFPAQPSLQFCRNQIRLHLEAERLRHDPDAAVMVSFSVPQILQPQSEAGKTLADLPSLAEARKALKEQHLPNLPQRFQALRTVLVALAEDIKGEEDG